MHSHEPHRVRARNRRRLTSLVLLAFVLLAAGCSKSPEEVRAAKAAEIAQTTGSLLVKANLPAATVEATRLPSADDATTAVAQGTVDKPLSRLLPGRYAVVVRADGWPENRGETAVEIGKTAELTLNFASGSLRLDSDPTGAAVKLGATALGKTPLVIPQLPVGECALSIEYPNWPAVPFKTTIAENVESSATVRLPHGKLTVESTPSGATVLIGGKSFGQTPLVWSRMPAGTKKLTLQAKDFPPLETRVTVEDGSDVKIAPELGTAFPLLDAAGILKDVWQAEDPNRLTASFEITGRFAPKNGIVKNLKRQRLHERWLTKRYRYSGTVKSYDAKSGEIEFNEDASEQSRFRVVAIPTPAALAALKLDEKTAKGATLTLHGLLSGVEEPRWPSRVITFELTAAEPLRGEAP
jgi:hypothetical protein